MREISYAEAINEALSQCMEEDPNVIIMGLEVDSERGIFGTTTIARKRFPERVLDMPLSENGITGFGMGAALVGMRPIMVHARIDFLMLAMDQIVNHAAKWHYMTGNQYSVPIVIRAIIGRGKGQGAQHAQALHAMFAGVAGLKVVMPATPFEAKSLLVAAVRDNDPVLFIEHRSLHSLTGLVPDKIDKPLALHRGCKMRFCAEAEITIAAFSYMVPESLKAAEMLAEIGLQAEVLNMISVRPLDEDLLLSSVFKTGHLVVADVGPKIGGIGGEVAAVVAEKAVDKLRGPIQRIGLPDYPVPTARHLEAKYYPTAADIANAALKTLGKPPQFKSERTSDDNFVGPF